MVRDDAADPEQSQQLIVALMHAYAHDAYAMVWSGGLVDLMTQLGSSRPAARMALSRLVRRGVLERAKQGRLVHHFLDAGVRRALERRDARIAALGDGERPVEAWTMVWHHGSEEARQERGQLWRRLRPMGFGSFEVGVWIAAHDRRGDIEQIVGELGLDGAVSAVIGSAPDRLAPRPERIWDLADLDARYRAYCESYGPLADAGEARDDQQAFVDHVRADGAFRAVAGDDPGLPLALAGGRPELRSAALETSKAIDRALAPAAQRHFDAVTTAWMGTSPPARAERAGTGTRPAGAARNK